ncbi:MAG: HAMP domain-containing protein [Deltaproteobacteria bacterium]|nr:HAMP domain-containing protein [Deltaproteobacteria bacterium]
MKIRRPSIRWLLLGANAFVLAVPVLALVALRLYDTYLVRQTERQLIAQSVVLAEIWRELWLAERGHEGVPPFRPPERAGDPFIPIEPVIDLAYGVAPPQAPPSRLIAPTDTPERRAGARLTPLLLRAQVFNLSATRVLDAQGCVVATSRSELDLCLMDFPEVQAALAGRYSAVARERVSDEPLPPLSDVRSRGSIRIFTALPVFSDGRVVGVVRMSRTSLDALTSLWHARRGLLLLLAATLGVLVLASVFFSAVIARPVRAITRTAEAVARGEALPQWTGPGFAPAEIGLLAQALDTMTRKLKERADYIATFAATVSHELKAPITSIRGAAELLAEHHLSDAQHARFIANIQADAERMERLVARLLHLARIEHASEPADDVDVRRFFAALIDRYGAAVQLDLEQAPARVQVTVDHLSSAVINLVENAVRHGGGAPVQVCVAEANGFLHVAVTDRGPGISPANQARIFERFFTTERDRGGTGLGLAIVKAVAERYQGRVSFTSTAGATTFVLALGRSQSGMR